MEQLRKFIREQLNTFLKEGIATYWLGTSDDNLNEAKKSKFEKLKDNKIPLTPEERKIVMDADAVWHHGLNGAPSPAVWKSKDKNGKITYVTNTHRAYQDRPTLKGAISIYHSFIKGTS